MLHLEEYRYTWLPTGKYTRLIRLLPTKRFEDPVKILLDVVSLEPPPKYEALSYAWENQTPDQPIDCGGQRLLVTQTCSGALRRLRRKKKPRTLWIDGICIDQHSTAEKNHQVALMGPIYSSAERVVIWLGEDRKGVDSMLNLLRYNRILFNMNIRQRHDLLEKAFDRHSAFMNSRLSDHGLHLSNLSESVPWFSRLWTVQEVELVRSAVILHGNTEVDFEKFLVSLGAALDQLRRSSSFFQMQTEILELRRSFIDGNNDDSWDKRLELVRRTALGKAALPHDKIYAIRAVLQRGLKEETFPLPDYDSDFNQLYWNTCVVLMRRSSRGLALIQDVGGVGNPPGIPSWVPDFNRPMPGFNSILTKDQLLESDRRQRFPAEDRPRFYLLDNDTKIATKAQLLTPVTGIVDHHGLYRSFSTLNTDEDQLRAVLSAAECASLWIKAGDSLSQAPSGQLAHLMFREASEDLKLRPIQLGLLELLRSTDKSTFDLARFQMYREAQSEAGRKENTTLAESTPRGIEVKFKALLSWNKESEPRYAESGPEKSFWDYFLRFWNSCNGSALFWTENNAMGIALPARRVGDVLALIPGLEWPMLLRRSANGNFKVVSPAFIRRDQGWYMFRKEKLQHIVLE
ncbi:Heterokaryon incompatibility protein 6, OR allele 2 [Colletotrichum sojae]|uniref:Heterokaryon incompatibility protein 6, OR allele 2 n=1 Tax=Colletotrichum sojae TaxID=2175907 RepID=A0A8H6J342_9PEZI|nr:Heterokaryon incompatibility protein 6, OR allele 2 [Colletotrichum sojae]